MKPLGALALFLVASACSHGIKQLPPPEPLSAGPLKEKIASELQCPAADLFVQTWPIQIVADGCGRLAVYEPDEAGGWKRRGVVAQLDGVEPVETNLAITRPEPIGGPNAPDPSHLKTAGLGDVTYVLKCVVGIDGRARDCIPMNAPPFPEPVIEWTTQRRYKPSLYRGKPIPVVYVFHVKVDAPD